MHAYKHVSVHMCRHVGVGARVHACGTYAYSVRVGCLCGGGLEGRFQFFAAENDGC